jgi:uncharacterized membrane protein
MTAADGIRPARRRWLIGALVVSLAVNLFLIGVAVGTIALVRAESGPPGWLARVAERLQLTPAQLEAFRHFQAVARQHGHAMRETNGKIWATLGDPATKPDQIAGLIDESVKNRTQFQQEVATAFGQFLTSLTPEQRARFISGARAAHRFRGPMRLLHRLAH